MPASLGRIARLIGSLIAVVCVGFLLWRLTGSIPDIRLTERWQGLALAIGLATLIYSSGNALLGVAWWLLLQAGSNTEISAFTAACGHMRAQLAKYLPGNVFHLAARHAEARRSGISHISIASAAAAESAILVVVAVLLSVSISQEQLPAAIRWSHEWRWILPMCLFLVLVAGYRLLHSRYSGLNLRHSSWRQISRVIAAFICYASFFVLAGFAFMQLIKADTAPIHSIIAIVATCWLGGFLVFGAPGGVGVREVLMIAMLTPRLGEANALVAAISFRLVTILSDLILFAVSLSDEGFRMMTPSPAADRPLPGHDP